MSARGITPEQRREIADLFEIMRSDRNLSLPMIMHYARCALLALGNVEDDGKGPTQRKIRNALKRARKAFPFPMHERSGYRLHLHAVNNYPKDMRSKRVKTALKDFRKEIEAAHFEFGYCRPLPPRSLDELLPFLENDLGWVEHPDGDELNWENIPTFGGEAIPEEDRWIDEWDKIWSWDESRMIIGNNTMDVRIVPRKEVK